MAYEVVMPQLSDSMEEGTLVAWKKKVGDTIAKGEVIAEVESDKAIMELQCFQAGTVSELLIQEDEQVKVGAVIARVETEAERSRPVPAQGSEEAVKPVTPSIPKPEPEPEITLQSILDITSKAPKTENPQSIETAAEVPHTEKASSSAASEPQSIESPIIIGEHALASPKAKAMAAKLGLDLYALQKAGSLAAPVNERALQEYLYQHYFTKKAQALLQRYHLSMALFHLDHKINSDEVEAYIKREDIPEVTPISMMQKAIINTVTASAEKPIYHIYDAIDSKLIEAHHSHSMTVWLLKLFAITMMKHPAFRSTLAPEGIQVWPHAHIALAVASGKELYMPVLKNVEQLTASEIADTLKADQETIKKGSLGLDAMKGSTFGISNLGMLGIERFDAMINKNDSGIAAIGSVKAGEISVTLTLDHRLINGYEGALFIKDLKAAALDAVNFKE